MKKISILFLLVFLMFGFKSIQEISLQKDSKKASQLNLDLTSPKYSPSGKYILATSTKYSGLIILNSKDFSIYKTFLKNENIGYGACWSVDSKKIYFRKKEGYTFYTYLLDIESDKITQTNLNPQYLTTKGFNGEIKKIAYINEKLQLVYINENQKESFLTADDNNYYHLVMNPGANKFVIHNGSDIVLVNVITGENKTIGKGIANAISKNNRYVFYHLDSSKDGHHITNSELYVYDIEMAKTTELTQTSNNIELWADLSLDGKTLLYSNEKTGEVESIKISY
jgi:Tol biopolymer transport system component